MMSSSCSEVDDSREAEGRSHVSFILGAGVDVMAGKMKLSSGFRASGMGPSERVGVAVPRHPQCFYAFLEFFL